MSDYKAYNGRGVIITGGLGFIGSNLAHRLVSLGARVTIIDSLLPDCGGNLFNINGIEDKVYLLQCDIASDSDVASALAEVDFVFNLAGKGSHRQSMAEPLRDLQVNCHSQLAFLESCRRVNLHARIIYTSTRQVYGRPCYLPVNEGHPLAPADVNAVHKLTVEGYHLLYHRVYGLRSSVVRLTNCYGPRCSLRTPDPGFVTWFIGLALQDKEITLYGDGSQLRDANYVDDVVDCLLTLGLCENAAGQVFNLGGPPFRVRELAETLVNMFGRGRYRFIPFPEEMRPIDIGDYYGDYGKLKALTSWRPRYSLEEGLQATEKFYRNILQNYL